MGLLAEKAGDESDGDGYRTFVIENEGHTLGNALRSIISSYPEVNLCGYTIPHPTENKLHLRIQSKTARAIDLLQRGLEELSQMCDHTIETFDDAMKTFNESK